MGDTINSLEDKLANNLDEMLVDNGIEKPRGHQIERDNLITKRMGLLVTKRVSPRATIQFKLLKNAPLESFFIVTYKDNSCCFKITDCSIINQEQYDTNSIKHILKIKIFIKQMWRNYQHVLFELLDELYTTTTDKIHRIISEQHKNR